MIRVSTILPLTKLTAAPGNFDASRSPISPIDKIIIHTIVGSITGATARFNKAGEQASAHYGIGLDGKLYQWVDEDKTAYHAGKYEINRESIGIEHEDGTNPQTNPDAYDKPRPDMLYETSGKLVADICKFYAIPLDRAHILKHNEISATHCPGTLDVDRIIAIAGTNMPPPVDPEYVKALETDRKKFWAERDEALTKLVVLQGQYTSLQGQLSAFEALGYKTPADLQDKLKELVDKIDGLMKELLSVNARNAVLAQEIQKKDAEDATAIDEAIALAKENNKLKADLASVKSSLGTKMTVDISKVLETIKFWKDQAAKALVKKPSGFKPGTLAPEIPTQTEDNLIWKSLGLGVIFFLIFGGIILTIAGFAH